MKKQIISVFLALMMVLSLLPTTALAVEPEDVSGAPAEAEFSAEPVDQPSEETDAEPPAEPDAQPDGEDVPDVPGEEEGTEGSLAPRMALAGATGGDTLELKNANGDSLKQGTDYIVSGKTYTITTKENIVITGGDPDATVRLESGDDSNVTLDNVTGLKALYAQTGYEMNVTLVGENHVGYIYGSENGASQTHIVIGGDGALTGHHIGGEYNYDVVSADITITGGTIELDGLDGNSSVGARYGAAIGGGNPGGIAKNITITGGEITVSSMYGAGIGGGSGGNAENIIIEGGKITATSISGAAIGGGQKGSAKKITITGGTVTANGDRGAGIGGGYTGNAENINISGGTVTASAHGGAAIGGGQYGGAKNITITGGTVTATTSIQSSGLLSIGAAIGGGGGDNKSYTSVDIFIPPVDGITISGGTVTASAPVGVGFIGNAVGCGFYYGSAYGFHTSIATNVSISCGTYTGSELVSSYIAEGYKLVQNGTVWEVMPKYVAQIGTTKYETFAEAIAAARAATTDDGKVITVIGEVPGYVFSDDNMDGITIQGSETGKITGSFTAQGTNSFAGTVFKNLKFENGSIVLSTNHTSFAGLIIQGCTFEGHMAQHASIHILLGPNEPYDGLTISGNTITHGNSTDCGVVCGIYVNGYNSTNTGTVTISGNIVNDVKNSALQLEFFSGTATVNVTGNNFNSWSAEKAGSLSLYSNVGSSLHISNNVFTSNCSGILLFAEPYESPAANYNLTNNRWGYVIDGQTVYLETEAEIRARFNLPDNVCVTLFNAACIGDQEYASLAEAIAVVQDGTETEIDIIADIDCEFENGTLFEIPANKNIILDLTGIPFPEPRQRRESPS